MTVTIDQQSIAAALTSIVGAANVLTGDATLPFATDVYRRFEVPLAVVRPESVEQLQAIVRIANEQGVKVGIRGGGASYTDGYILPDPNSILLDMGGLNKIVEINEVDGFVTVEAGVTWAQLKETLAKQGLRTPFWGPFSGLRATVGGSMSQNSISHGSGSYGISADSALGFDVVTANGALLRTGTAAAKGNSPFTRHFGPDLTGLFTGDCGTLAIKARVTLPLLKIRPAHATLSFAFPTFDAMHEGMRLVAAERIEDTHFALDAALSQGQIARQDRAGGTFDMALSIMKSSPSFATGIKQLIKAATSARKVIGNSAYMVHYIVEGFDELDVKSRQHRIRQIVEHLADEIPSTVPAVVRGMPFAPFYNTLGPNGERWVPLHGVLPHSKVKPFHARFQQFLAERKAEMDKLGVWTGLMYGGVGSGGFLYEIALYWPDEQTEYHTSVIPADYMANLPKYPANPEARAYVHQLKSDMIDLLVEYGCTNYQLGRAYPYADRLLPEPLALVKSIKDTLDPSGQLSPGGLGL